MDDAINYALSSYAEVDVFVTRNRRGVLSAEYRKTLDKCNRKVGLKFVEVMTPKQFYEFLLSKTP